MFKRYVKANNTENRVELLYLLLNNYDPKEIDRIEDAEEDKEFGLKYRILYGITKEFVDKKKIKQELDDIKTPVIYSPQTFELYAKSQTIHVYTPEIETIPMVINDLGIISTEMIITRKCIVSKNVARREDVIPDEDRGFMYFMNYVLKEDLRIGKWHIQYEDKCFAVNYVSKGKNGEHEEALYMAMEIDKTSTYKLVIYIIKKVCASHVDKWESDNFIDEAYELITS